MSPSCRPHRIALWVLVPALLLFGSAIVRAAFSPRSSLLGPIYWRGSSSTREVALTFDDGPDPRWTPGILRELERAHAPATFFLEGENVRAHPSLVRWEVRDGDEIGNHSWDHHSFLWLGPRQIGSELDRTESVIKKTTGRTPRLFRPPYGRRNPFVWPEAQERGLQLVGWGLSPWRGRSPRPSDLVKQTLRGCRPGTILLLHDARGNRRQTVEALPAIIGDLRARGYRFVTVSQLEATRARHSCHLKL